MKKTKLLVTIEDEQAALHRQAKRVASKLVKDVNYLEKCINDGIFPLWLVDIKDKVDTLYHIAHQQAVLSKVKHTRGT
jgi:hypothetical protein